jgi:hypothetical protein
VGEVLEVDDVQRAGALVEAVAIFAGVESEERAEKEADGRLVRDDQDPLVAVLFDDAQQRRQRARGDRQAAFAVHRRKAVRVVLVPRILLGELALDVGARLSLPPPVPDLAQALVRPHLDVMRLRDQPRGVHRPLERAGVRHADRLAGQPRAEAAGLIASGLGEEDVDGAGEAVFRG